MATLKTPPEYGDDGRLTERCIQALLTEVDATHKPRMDAIESALRRMDKDSTLTLGFEFTFGKKE